MYFALAELDITLSFILLQIYLFQQDVIFEAFDEFENVNFADFQLKHFVFNAAAADRLVTFWFPAFSMDDKVVFQSRYIEILS